MPKSIIYLLLLAFPSIALTEDLTTTWKRATQLNQVDVIEKHLAFIDNVNVTAPNGKTALMAAASQGATAVVKRLLAAGGQINLNNNLGGSPLMYAAGSGSLKTVQIMVAHGAALNHHSLNGWGALMMAAAKNYDHIVQYLCTRGADVNLADIYGWTPLMRAAYEGHAEAINVLLKQADIALEHINDHGQTALHLAVIQKHRQITRLLLAAGAEQSADFAGHTPYSIAEILGQQDLLALLQQHQHQH